MIGVAVVLAAKITKLSEEEEALESFVQDVARVHFDEGLNGVQKLCGSKFVNWFQEPGFQYGCRVDGKKITVYLYRVNNKEIKLVGKKVLARGPFRNYCS